VHITRSKFHGDLSADSKDEVKRAHADVMEVKKSCFFISYDGQ